jgi:hypothetical protein
LSTVTPNSTTAPNGTTTADTLIEDTATSIHCVQVSSISVISGTSYTLSCYAKPAGRNFIQLLLTGGFAGNIQAIVDLTNGTVGSTVGSPVVTVTSLVNGWYRISITATATSTTTTTVQIRVSSNSGTGFYTGDGTSGIYVWGAMLEQSSTVGDYVPTTSTINSAPRFDHNPTTGESLGLLVEEARTNLLVRSEEFDSASWVKISASSTVTANAAVAPNGTLTADKIVEATNTGIHCVQQIFNTATTAATYTLSVYAKAAERSSIEILDAYALKSRTFNLSNGTSSVGQTSGAVGAPLSYSITDVGNGWYLCTISLAAVGANVSHRISTSNGSTTGYTGDGTSGLFLWGAQLEEGSFPTSYIPTTSATVTRAADVAGITGSNFSSWYNQTEGTVFAEASTQQSAASHVLAGVSTGSFGSSAYLSKENNNVLFASPNAAPSNLSIARSSVSSNVGLRAGLAFTAGTGSASAVMNGGAVGTDASTGIPITMSQMAIGSAPWSIGSAPWNGTIKRLTYWPTRLANTTLQQITQP